MLTAVRAFRSSVTSGAVRAHGRRPLYSQGAASTLTFPLGGDRDERKQHTAAVRRREFHATAKRDSATFLIAGTGVALACVAGAQAIQAWEDYQERKKDGKPVFGRSMYGTKFYEGGFESPMTRREAALILGVRESADKKRIRGAHRRLLMLNHPDTGGSTLIATKLNEAKDMLLK